MSACLDFLNNTQAVRRFKAILREPSSSKRKEDPFYRRNFTLVSEAYLQLPNFDRELQRKALPLVVDYLYAEWGLDAALSSLLDLVNRGIDPGIVAIYGQSACRKANDYQKAESFCLQLLEMFPNHQTVIVVAGQSVVAISEGKTLDDLEIYARNIATPTQWFVSEWAQLKLNNHSFDNLNNWLIQIEDPELSDFLNERLKSFSIPSQESPQATVLSLYRDDRKWDLCEKALQFGGYQPNRFKATDGRELPRFALKRLGFGDEVAEIHGAGAIATALSHIAILEDFLDSGEERRIVVEDDASPFYHYSYYEEFLKQCGDVELLWANERMSQHFGIRHTVQQKLETPVQILATRNPALNGLGTDCYIVNRAGAEKILESFSVDMIQAHVDAQLAAYACDPKEEVRQTTRSQEAVGRLRSNLISTADTSPTLYSRCLTVPMIWANNHGSSDTNTVSLEKTV